MEPIQNLNKVELTVEEQFRLATFNRQVDQMSLEQARELLKTTFREMTVREVAYRELIKKNWSIV